MPTWLKLTLIAALTVAGLIAARSLDEAPPQAGATSAALRPAELVVVNQAGTVSIDGSTGTDLRDRIVALAETLVSGNARLTATSLQVEGVASTRGRFAATLAQLRDRVPDDIELSIDVFVIDDAIALEVLCARMFEEIRDAPVQFHEATIEMRSASLPALDRLVDFALDCRQSSMTIVGHSDSTGDPAYNMQLSRRRAEAVVDYFSQRGVAAERLTALGAGSTQPIADNATGVGREKNRRIEFTLGPPT